MRRFTRSRRRLWMWVRDAFVPGMTSNRTYVLKPEDLRATRNCELAALLLTLGFEQVDNRMQVLSGDGVPGRRGVWRFLPALRSCKYVIQKVVGDGLNPRLAEDLRAYPEQAWIAAGYHNYRLLVESVMRGSRLRRVKCGYVWLLLRAEGCAQDLRASDVADEAFVYGCSANTELVAGLATLGFDVLSGGHERRIEHGRMAHAWCLPPVSADGAYRLDEVMARWDDAAWCARPENNHPVACLSDAFFNLRRLRAELRESDEYVRVSSGRRTVVVRRGASREFVRQAERFLLK